LLGAAFVWAAAGCGSSSLVVPDGGTGGAGGHGGSGGAATDAGTDSGATGAPISFTFDSDLQGFGLDPFQSTAPGAVRNLNAPPFLTTAGAGGSGGAAGAGGAGGAGGDDGGAGGDDGGVGPVVLQPVNQASLAFDATDGNPAPGSLQITAPFTDFNQIVDVAFRVTDPTQLIDMSGRTLHVKVRLTSGSFSGGAVLYVLTTTSYNFVQSGWTLLLNNQWRDIAIDMRRVPNANQVIGLGVQFGTGAPTAVPGDGGLTPAFTITTPVFNVDTFTD
jgi:hypothetical protein